MKTLRSFSLSVLAILTLIAAQACVPTTNIPATATLAPESATQTPTLPTLKRIANGQIAYIKDGNVWRYILETGESIQVTTQNWDGQSHTSYLLPRFSPDGRYVAYIKFRDSYVSDLVKDTVIDLTQYGEFIGWAGQGYEFFAKLGNRHFEIYRYDLNKLNSPVLLATIKGSGTVYEVSSDGQWASMSRPVTDLQKITLFNHTSGHWHLPTVRQIALPDDLSAGSIDYSPDSKYVAMVKSSWFSATNIDYELNPPTYVEGPLYVANMDLSVVTPIFTEPQTEVGNIIWSPDGQWIAFDAVKFALTKTGDGLNRIGRKVLVVQPDGSNLRVVEDGDATLRGLSWSPDGSKLLYWKGSDF